MICLWYKTAKTDLACRFGESVVGNLGKKTVALTGASGTMGYQTFRELYSRKDCFRIVVLLRDSAQNRKKFRKYENDPAVQVVWGNP